MAVMFRCWARVFFVMVVRLLCHLLFRVTIEGREHAPVPVHAPGLLVISNHFSWFDAPIISVLLPYPPAYLIAAEAMDKGWFHTFFTLFESIPIWRGQVDRQALTTAVRRLKEGGIVGIFPEGGINPALVELVATGQQIAAMQGNMSRTSGTLISAKPGVALLATMSGAQILPVALIGSETLLENLRHWRRPAVTLRIGPPFGPLTIASDAKGAARRQQLDELSHEMMRQVAALFPPHKRGYYAEVSAATLPASAVDAPVLTTDGGSGVKM